MFDYSYKLFYSVLILLFALLSSCESALSKDYSVDFEKDLRNLLSDSTSIEVQRSADTLYLKFSNMPDSRTNDEYNQLLMAYIYVKSQPISNQYGIKNTLVSIEHSYNSLRYSLLYNESNTIGIIEDYKNKKYVQITEFLIKNVFDEHHAYYNLSMEEARSLFPKAKTSESIYSLLSKCSFKDDDSVYSLKQRANLDLELKLFYWVSQYPYGDLSFDREQILNKSLEILKIDNYKDWNLDTVTKKYKELDSM